METGIKIHLEYNSDSDSQLSENWLSAFILQRMFLLLHIVCPGTSGKKKASLCPQSKIPFSWMINLLIQNLQ